MIRLRGPRWGLIELMHTLGSLIPKDSSDSREQLNRILRKEIPGWNFLPLISGRVALAFALKLLGAKKGNHVAVPAFCCGAVITSIRELKAKPMFVDMEPDTLSISINSLEKAVKNNSISAIVMAHAVGALSDISAIFSIARDFDIPVIDDAAYLSGLKCRDGSTYGTKGDLGIWSFNNKGLYGLGGGVLLYPDRMERRVQRNLFHLVNTPENSLKATTIKEGMGNFIRSIFKSKIPQFLTGDKAPTEKLPGQSPLPFFGGYFFALPTQTEVMIDQWRKREIIAGILDRNLSIFEARISKIPGISVMPLKHGGKYTQYLPIILEKEVPHGEQTVTTSDWEPRYRLRTYLYRRGIQSLSGYPPYFLSDGNKNVCPNCQSYWKRIVFLPAHSLISPACVRYIADVLESWIRNPEEY